MAQLFELVELPRHPDVLIAEEEHHDRPSVVGGVLVGLLELVDRPARRAQGRGAGPLPHDAEIDVVVDGDLAVDDRLRRADVGERVGLVVHDLDAHVALWVEELQRLVHVADEVLHLHALQLHVGRRRQEDADDPHPTHTTPRHATELPPARTADGARSRTITVAWCRARQDSPRIGARPGAGSSGARRTAWATTGSLAVRSDASLRS